MSSSFILLAIMIVFLVIFSPGLKWSSKRHRQDVILNFDWWSIKKGSNILPKHKQAVNMTSWRRATHPTWTSGGARAATAGTPPPPSPASRACRPGGGGS